VLSTTTGAGGPVALGAEEPRHVGTVLELADGTWTEVGAIAHLERLERQERAQPARERLHHHTPGLHI
jgi:hypothetical protein